MEVKQRKAYYKRSLDYVPQVYKPTDLAYFAGIVDGEGCFYIGLIPKKSGDGYASAHYRGLLKVDNTAMILIDWLNSIFSGTNSAQCKPVCKGQFRSQVYSWIVTGDRLLDLCEQVLPYLTIKKRQCEIMIKFRKSYTEKLGSHKLSEESIATRQECFEAVRKLNSRWFLHPMRHNVKE